MIFITYNFYYFIQTKIKLTFFYHYKFDFLAWKSQFCVFWLGQNNLQKIGSFVTQLEPLIVQKSKIGVYPDFQTIELVTCIAIFPLLSEWTTSYFAWSISFKTADFVPCVCFRSLTSQKNGVETDISCFVNTCFSVHTGFFLSSRL